MPIFTNIIISLSYSSTMQAQVASVQSIGFTSLPITGNGVLHLLLLVCILVLLGMLYSLYQQRSKYKNKLKDLIKTEEVVITRLLDSMSAKFIFVDTHGTIVYVNQHIFKDLDINRKDIIGKKITDVLSVFREQNDILPKVLEELQQGKEQIDFSENTYLSEKDTDGIQLIAGSAFGIRGRKGKLLYFLFFFRDVNREKRYAYTMDMILNSTKIFPWTIEIQTGILSIDPRYFEYLGRPSHSDQITTEDFRKIIHPDDASRVFDALREQFNGMSMDAFVSYRLIRGDGSWEWFEAQSTYMKSVSGSPFQLVGICMSTQKYKETELTLQKALEAAKESEQLKSAFLANMSHEIRTPLNAILGFSALLTDNSMELDGDEAKEYAAIIDRNGHYLLTLISDILDLSRIESNTITFDIQQYSLNALLTDIYRTQSLLMPPEIKLELRIPEYNTYIQTDSLRLAQVVNNLINNARKFTTEGSISFGYQLENDGREVYLFVKDTGCGMEREELLRIFDRFYKGSPHVQGTGLGLSICKTIIEKLNGTISVISTKGIGTEFCMHLPSS